MEIEISLWEELGVWQIQVQQGREKGQKKTDESRVWPIQAMDHPRKFCIEIWKRIWVGEYGH